MRSLFAILVAGSLALGAANTHPAFADVPPCHWAADAVAELAGTGIFIGFPPDDAYLSVNALRQVFEGLRCAEPAWSLRFLDGASDAFTAGVGPALVGFALEPRLVSRDADRAEVAFTLTTVIDDDGVRSTETRAGTAEVRRSEVGWRVVYADLLTLALPVFPR
jgi:hypothetical protein